TRGGLVSRPLAAPGEAPRRRGLDGTSACRPPSPTPLRRVLPMFLSRRSSRAPTPRPPRPLRLPQAPPALRCLETRVVPYATTGNLWPSAQVVTISFVPDGTALAEGDGGPITSNMFSAFNAMFRTSVAANWENIILKAAQTWAAQTNINFSVI